MFMLAGPNGAGKSTLYELVIRPRVDAPFINADVIQRDELKNPSMEASYEAARIAEQRRRQHLAERTDFVSESTFSHPSKLALIEEAKDAGFRVALYHVNVRDANLSVLRVASRTRNGGHDVPEDKIRERYARNQALIRQAMLVADYGFVYDNSRLNRSPERVIDFKAGRVIRVSGTVPAWARELYAQELQHVSASRLNPAAASFAEAQQLAQRLDAGAQLRIPERDSINRGEVVGETALHWVQRTEPGLFIAHIKSAVDQPLQLHGFYDISYPKRGAVVRPTSPEAIERSQAMAKVFLEVDEGAAIARFPELRGAYQALRTMARAMPASNTAAAAVAKEQLAKFVAAGRVPPTAPEPVKQLAPAKTPRL